MACSCNSCLMYVISDHQSNLVLML
jgi:hypothetical protein